MRSREESKEPNHATRLAVLMMGLLVAGTVFYMNFPELRRYMRIRRM